MNALGKKSTPVPTNAFPSKRLAFRGVTVPRTGSSRDPSSDEKSSLMFLVLTGRDDPWVASFSLEGSMYEGSFAEVFGNVVEEVFAVEEDEEPPFSANES